MIKNTILTLIITLAPSLALGGEKDEFCYFKELPGIERDNFIYTGHLEKKHREKNVPNDYWTLNLNNEISKRDHRIQNIELWHDNAFKNIYFKPFLKNFDLSKQVDVCGHIVEFRGEHYLEIHQIRLHKAEKLMPCEYVMERITTNLSYFSKGQTPKFLECISNYRVCAVADSQVVSATLIKHIPDKYESTNIVIVQSPKNDAFPVCLVGAYSRGSAAAWTFEAYKKSMIMRFNFVACIEHMPKGMQSHQNRQH